MHPQEPITVEDPPEVSAAAMANNSSNARKRTRPVDQVDQSGDVVAKDKASPKRVHRNPDMDGVEVSPEGSPEVMLVRRRGGIGQRRMQVEDSNSLRKLCFHNMRAKKFEEKLDQQVQQVKHRMDLYCSRPNITSPEDGPPTLDQVTSSSFTNMRVTKVEEIEDLGENQEFVDLDTFFDVTEPEDQEEVEPRDVTHQVTPNIIIPQRVEEDGQSVGLYQSSLEAVFQLFSSMSLSNLVGTNEASECDNSQKKRKKEEVAPMEEEEEEDIKISFSRHEDKRRCLDQAVTRILPFDHY